MMTYCLNSGCQQPLNPEGVNFCQGCGLKLIPLLRNRYRIVRQLGDGGFGRTFLAEDIDRLNEYCVVKQLAPQVEGSWALQKATELFKQEAERLQHLGTHPQIPALYAYFEENQQLYLVQQFIKGQNLLMELHQQGVFPEQKIWELLNQLLPILQFLHQQHVIHRDIKPANIIRRSLSREASSSKEAIGDLVLIDFGIAKQLTATTISKPGTTIGSCGYASFEQMKTGEAYAASDLYSLGATCFHLLTGVDPSELWTEKGYGWVTEWQRYLKHPISPNLKRVMRKLLQKDVKQRYQSASEVLRDLAAAQSQRNRRFQVKGNYKKFWFLLLDFFLLPYWKYWCVVFVISLLGIGGYGYLSQRSVSPQTTSIWQKMIVAKTLIGHANLVRAVVITPDGQTIISGSNDNTIKIWQLNTGQLKNTLTGHSNLVSSLALSPDGQTLASGSGDNTIKIWQLNTGQLKNTLTGHSNWVNSIAISPDGQTLASGSGDNTIKIWQLNTGQLKNTLTGHAYAVNSIAISPDGETLVSGHGSIWPLGEDEYTIKIWRLKSGLPRRTLVGHLSNVNAVAISRDGQTIVSGSSDKTIRLWQLKTGSLRTILTGHTGAVLSVALSPDGQTLATGSSDSTIKIWQLSTGNLLATLSDHAGPVLCLAISPDGNTLVSGSSDQTIKIWRLPKY